MEARHIKDDVFVVDGPTVTVMRREVERLKLLAGASPRRRARLCAHLTTDDVLHEMLIALDAATYVRPHRHRNKRESFHVVEGALTILLFDDDGLVTRTIPLGDYASARPFYYRLAEPIYHTVLVESPVAVIHETTNGPFDRADMEFAPWAPPEEDAEAGRRYLQEVAADAEVIRT